MGEVANISNSLSELKSPKKWVVIGIVIFFILIIGIIYLKFFSVNKNKINDNPSQSIVDLCNNQTLINQLIEQHKTENPNLSSQDVKDGCIVNFVHYAYGQNPNVNYTDACNKIVNIDIRGQCLALAVSGTTSPNIKYYPLELFNNITGGIGYSGNIRNALYLTTQPNGSAAWFAAPIMLPRYVRGIHFNAVFADNSNAQGLLTAYVNTQEIGLVLEKAIDPYFGNQYSFLIDTSNPLFSGIDSQSTGPYTLSFRLDAFNQTFSKIEITNISTMTMNAPE